MDSMSDREQQPDALEVSEGAVEAAPVQPAAEPAVADPNARPRVWYVIHTYSGYENKVKKALEQRLADAGMQQEIFKVVVPTEEEVEIKDGHRRTVERRVFPGYVLVEMLQFKENDIRSDEAWYLVRQTTGVTSFVGEEASRPTPLSQSDVAKIMGRMQQAQPKVKINFKVGNNVRITDGPFADFIGMVDELMVDKGKVRVLVNFFGRETPVELDFIQVEKQ
jgi:transcriptional antiterminator NusG